MKIAIVTGASSGMGKEFVKSIIDSSMELDEIWVLARRKNRLESWEKLYKDQRFRLLTLDLNESEDREKFRDEVAKVEPEIEVFVHAAGFGIIGNIEELGTEEQEEMLEVNGKAVISVTMAVLPYMQEYGRMIYLASSAAFLPQPGFAVYAATKAFVLSYVRSLRVETRKRHLKVTAVCPGAVKTEFFTRASAKKPMPAYKKLVMADMKKVVKKAWKDNEHNKEISVYGKSMKIFWVITKIVPHRWILSCMGRKSI